MAKSNEQMLISSILRDRDYTTAVAHGISAEMFVGYAEEWKWLETYYRKHRKVPTKAAFVNHFPEFRVKAVNDTTHFVDEVRKDHARHMLMGVMRDTTDLIAEGDIDKAVNMVTSKMVIVAASMGAVQDLDVLSDWKPIYQDVKARKDRYDASGMSGIPTGFDTLDERTGGAQFGQSWIIGARLGEKKSWTLLRMATAAVMAGYTVHFAALEMSKVEVGMRFHNFLSGQVGKTIFNSLDLAQGRDFDPKAYREFLRSLKSHVKGQMTISDNSNIGSMEIAAQIERHRPDIYFLDYLTLAKTGGDGGWMDIGKFSKDIKHLAKEYNVSMVSAAQLNRTDGMGKEAPGANSLAKSDDIGQDADAVITTKQLSPSINQFFMAKYRHGPGGFKWYTHMDMSKGIFKEVSYNKAMDIRQKERDAELEAQENSR